MHQVRAVRFAGGHVSIAYADDRIDAYELTTSFFTDLADALDDAGWLALRAALSAPGRWLPAHASPAPMKG